MGVWGVEITPRVHARNESLKRNEMKMKNIMKVKSRFGQEILSHGVLRRERVSRKCFRVLLSGSSGDYRRIILPV